MLFSCKLQESSVKLVEPVQTAPVGVAPSRTTYLWCISLGICGSPPVIGLDWTLGPRRRTKSAVPGGAGSPPLPGKSACGLPAS